MENKQSSRIERKRKQMGDKQSSSVERNPTQMEDKQSRKRSPLVEKPTDLPCNPIESVLLAATVAAEVTSVVVIFRSKQSNKRDFE